MTINKTFRYDTFNPNTNDFESEYESFTKTVDMATEKKYNLIHNIRWGCICMLLPFLIAAFVFGGISEAVECFWWAILACVGCMMAFTACIFTALALEEKEDEIEEQFRDTAFEEEKAECKKYNEEQKAIAEKWRAKHPFEEKIRMSQVRGSSVDIAEMVRYYAEYINNGKEKK